MTNQKQIALDLGISVATVSNALTGKGRVSEDVIGLVTSRAEQLGYIPNPAGRALKTGRSGILGMVIPDITQLAFAEFAQGMEAEAGKCGFGVLIANARGNETGQTDAIRQLVQRGVDGIVIIPQRGTTPEMPSVPVAVISTQDDPRSTVSANHRQGGALSAQALLDLGHRNFLLLGDDSFSKVQVERIAGMIDVLEGSAFYDVCWAMEEFPDLLHKHQKGMTAVLAVSDLLALRVITEAAGCGIRCPETISVIGFDDLPLATAIRPTLSSITANIPEISKRAVAYLSAAVRQERDLPKPSTVENSLLLRQSVGPANTKLKPKEGE